ncbi:MAG TPA: hypothetical protein VFH61_08125 [Thermoleophilia bacterium]|nr:hypothetical protein [Thermoleophilia bacterium]
MSPTSNRNHIDQFAQQVFLAFAQNLDILSFAQHVAEHNKSCDEGEAFTVGEVLAAKSFDWSEAWFAEYTKRHAAE